MTTATITETDLRLRDAVVRQLDWDPEVDASAIGVTAKNGVITLTGFIDTYAGKLTAERVAKRVRGVRAVANDLMVRLMIERTDADIAADVAQALALRPAIGDTVQAAVHHGHVTLTGTVEWLYQKELAASIVRHLRGVTGLVDYIAVRPRAAQRDIRRRIVHALHNNADLDARHITIAVRDGEVTLSGTVASWLQRETAERAAGAAPGIIRVDNQIVVEPPEPYDLDDVDEIC